MLFAAHARIGYGMGIDFSEHAIAQAIQERDRRGMTKLDFVRRDIYLDWR